LVYDSATSKWINSEVAGGATVSETAPANPSEGDLWLNSTEAKMYVYYNDGVTSQWVAAVGGTVPQQGKVLQVVSTTKTDAFATTSIAYTNVTGLSATITPGSESSKILIIASYMTGFSATGPRTIETRLVRNGVEIGGEQASSQSNDSNRDTNFVGVNFLDSPASTSALTYQIQVGVTGSTGYIGRTGADGTAMMSSITLMEIAE
jgi:hypothetical protein